MPTLVLLCGYPPNTPNLQSCLLVSSMCLIFITVLCLHYIKFILLFQNPFLFMLYSLSFSLSPFKFLLTFLFLVTAWLSYAYLILFIFPHKSVPQAPEPFVVVSFELLQFDCLELNAVFQISCSAESGRVCFQSFCYLKTEMTVP